MIKEAHPLQRMLDEMSAIHKGRMQTGEWNFNPARLNSWITTLNNHIVCDEPTKPVEAEPTYEDRANNTLAMRLLVELHENGVIGDYSYAQLIYPSHDNIEKAESLLLSE